ncbi:hypothetical protein FOA43_003349 [Brettanomyces nanus]|uniref:Condensin complex subunit 2 n=1 Tax=Eeniella nana TaxID=13502 RepID=A0A875S4W8_EENNA|nr:uncharacterized protein FOA43_003349 [Brettanomyces nanus]QPG75963.1 hypothetical protein FOA43_003349 [Brettanomyces nanus]
MTETSGGETAVTSENFELWIRMATDNKINSSNSWNFALIDYFHDMSMFREGDGINFQKASTTLDGCVKIYSSRIDSAATETGRLLSGLSSSEPNEKKSHTKEGETEEADGSDESDYEDEAARKRAKQRKSRRNRTKNTLADDFAQIKVKEVDKELLANPIFKKALSDFDEGGCRSLLMNMLHMSRDGRVLFVVTEKSKDSILNSVGELEVENDPPNEQKLETIQEMNEGVHSIAQEGVDADADANGFTCSLAKLGQLVSNLESDCKVCPSLDPLESINDGNVSATQILDQIGQIEYLNTNEANPDNVDMNNNGDYDDICDNYDNNERSTAEISKQNRSQYSLYLDEGLDEQDSTFKSLNLTRLFDENTATTMENEEDEEGGLEMAKYFDALSNRNWRGPEHWKISRIKSKFAEVQHKTVEEELKQKERSMSPTGQFTKKANQWAVLNFMSDGEDLSEAEIFKPGVASRLMVPQKQMEVQQGFNCLPEDLQFTTKRLICLNMKPDQRINTILTKKKKKLAVISRDEPNMVADESFFADVYKENDSQRPGANDFFGEDGIPENNDYTGEDVNGQAPETDYDDDVPANDIDQFEVPIQQPLRTILSQSRQHNNGGLNYARTSKRVDIRLLKQELWSTLQENENLHKKRDASFLDENKENINEDSLERTIKQTPSGEVEQKEHEDDDLKFSDVVSKMSVKYEGQAKKDLSTSFCFICMLHLANENGLTLEGTADNRDLIIKK